MENYYKIKKQQEMIIAEYELKIKKHRFMIHKALMIEIAKVCEKHKCNFLSGMGTWIFEFPCGKSFCAADYWLNKDGRYVGKIELLNRLIGRELILEIIKLMNEDINVGWDYIYERFKQHIRSDDQDPDFPSYTKEQVKRMFS